MSERLERAAMFILKARKWDNLSWDDAWSGKYPEPVSESEISAEVATLAKMTFPPTTVNLSTADGLTDYLRYLAVQEFASPVSTQTVAY